MQAKGVSINDDAGLEREADVMGEKTKQMTRAEQATTGSVHVRVRGLKQHAIERATNLVQQKYIGGTTESANISISPTDQIIRDINTSYQGIFERQIMGLDLLKEHIETPDRPSMSDKILGLIVSMALSAAIGALGSIAQTTGKRVVKSGLNRNLIKDLDKQGVALNSAKYSSVWWRSNRKRALTPLDVLLPN